MLVIGSRALRHAFPDARAPLDWDVIASAAELEELKRRLPPLEGVRSKIADKAFLRLERAPFEVLVAEPGSVWDAVLARPAVEHPLAGVGRVRFASPSLQLALKLAHVHLPAQWDKTVDDLDALSARGVTLESGDAALVHRLREQNDRWHGHAHGRRPPAGSLWMPRSEAGTSQRVALHRALGDRVGPWLDPARPHRAHALPVTAHESAALLAELVMVHAFLEHAEPERAVARSLREVCTQQLGIDVRQALAPHARRAAHLVRPGFAARLQRCTAHAPAAFALQPLLLSALAPWRTT